MTAKPTTPSLPALHEAIVSPLGRKYSRAQAWRPAAGALRVELTFEEPDLVDAKPTTQAVYYDLDPGAVGPAVRVPVGSDLKLLQHFEAGLELRLLPMPNKEEKELIAEVWGEGVRLARKPLGDKVGPKVLPAGIFGAPALSPSGAKIAWTCERPFEHAAVPGHWASEEAKEKASGPSRNKYELRRGLGEAIKVENTAIVVWDWQADELAVYAAEALLSAKDAARGAMAVASSVVWDGTDDGLIFAVHELPARSSGLSACLNRPTKLYHLPSLPPPPPSKAKDKEGGEAKEVAKEAAPAPVAARCLTPGLYLAHFPRLSPDGSRLAFAASAAPFAAHATVLELRAMAWPPPAGAKDGAVLLDAHAGPPLPTTGWAGLCGFHNEHAAMSWLSDGRLVVGTLAAGERAVFVCGDGPSSLRRLAPPGWAAAPGGGSVELMAAIDDRLVVQCSRLTTPAQVWACCVGASHDADGWSQLADSATLRSPPSASLAPVREHVRRVLAGTTLVTLTLPEADGGASALLAVPPAAAAAAEGGEGGESGKLPWVLRPHGGPHSATVDEFNAQTALLLSAGVAVLQPNYRGSLSFGKDFGESLLGRVGSLDVADCAALTRLALETQPTLDAARGSVYGGSHGGFLTAWLLGHPSHASLFRCGVLWNPVTNLPSMVTATDIPEWCFAECLPPGSSTDLGPHGVRWPLSPEMLAAMYEKSPITVVANVRAPALMLLGAGDLRVPHTQGREWVAALQSQPDPPEVVALEYPGEGHAIASAEQQAHAVQAAVAWLVQHTAPQAES